MNAKETLNKIHHKYSCKGDIIFRTAIQMVVEYGQQTFLDEEWCKNQFNEIDEKHDEAEKCGKWLIMTRDFEKAIFECAKELSYVNAYDFLMYIQKEVWLGGEVGELCYQETIEFLKECMNNIEDSKYTMTDTLDAFYDIGFSDEQIEVLGFGYLLDIEN